MIRIVGTRTTVSLLLGRVPVAGGGSHSTAVRGLNDRWLGVVLAGAAPSRTGTPGKVETVEGVFAADYALAVAIAVRARSRKRFAEVDLDGDLPER